MDRKVAGFDWDDGNRTKCQKHGVSLEEIEALFAKGIRVAPGLRHSQQEDRLIAAGKTASGRALFMGFTLREKNGRRLIRPVTARDMHAKEVAAYEKAFESEGSPSEERP